MSRDEIARGLEMHWDDLARFGLMLLVLAVPSTLAAERLEEPPEAAAPDAERLAPTVAGVPTPRVWLGRDGNPLPFQTHEEAIELLASGEVLDTQQIPIGVTRSQRVELEKDGVRFRAIFKTFNQNRERVRLDDGSLVLYLRDTYQNEAAAYELSRHLGMDFVPPTVLRGIRGRQGALQLWIEKAMMELERRDQGLTPPDVALWRRHLADMMVFDNLINNIDRNQGDILYDADWNFWWIDHSRSFGRERRLPRPERVVRCSTSLYEALRNLDEAEARRVLSPYMGRFEIQALMVRRDLLLELLDERIATLGPERVLFDYDVPAEPVPTDDDEAVETLPERSIVPEG